MKILVDITHPAHVHFFKNAIHSWQSSGHKVIITSREKDLTNLLLKKYGFEYIDLGRARKGILGLAFEMIERVCKLSKIVIKEKPSVLTGIGGTFIAPVGKFFHTPVIIFTDTEHAKISNKISFPLADVICTPECYENSIDKNQLTYAGYHELAYLHPSIFTPDASKLNLFGVSPNERYFVIRLVNWASGHDMGDCGFTDLKALVDALSPYGKVLISSESPLPDDILFHEIKEHEEEMHHLLAFATLYIGESATMASECAVLGVPSIFVSTSTRGYTNEQEVRYGLTYTFSDPSSAQKNSISKALELIKENDLRSEWQNKRDNMLKEISDINSFIISTVLKYGNASSR